MTRRAVHARARGSALGALVVALVASAFSVPVQAGSSRGTAIVEGEVDRTSIDVTATYTARAELDPTAGTLLVRTVIDVVNTSGGPIDRLELNTIAAALGDMELLAAKVDEVPVDVEITGQTITVPFGGVLPEGEPVQVIIRYAARLLDQNGELAWLWSMSDGIVSVYRWIPWVSLERKWPSDLGLGDPFFTPVSPHVEVTLTSTEPVVFVTNGQQVAKDGLSRTYVAENVRDFNFTAAPDFERLKGTSPDGETEIVVFTRGKTRPSVLKLARRAFDTFEDRLGQYPYPRFVISEASGNSGIESPGLVWVGRRVLGTSRQSYMVVHETAHMWFYGIVGSDQPRAPFADEGPAEFLTRWFLGVWRSSQCPEDRLDRRVYAYGGCIYETLYVQGALFLESIRADIGTTRFFRALRRYVKTYRLGMGGTYELLEAIRAQAKEAAVNLLPRYRERFPNLY